MTPNYTHACSRSKFLIVCHYAQRVLIQQWHLVASGQALLRLRQGDGQTQG